MYDEAMISQPPIGTGVKVRVPQLSTWQTEIYWLNETIRPSLDTILLIYKVNAVNFALLSAGKRCHLKFLLLT